MFETIEFEREHQIWHEVEMSRRSDYNHLELLDTSIYNLTNLTRETSKRHNAQVEKGNMKCVLNLKKLA
jgi:hypothetical protein